MPASGPAVTGWTGTAFAILTSRTGTWAPPSCSSTRYNGMRDCSPAAAPSSSAPGSSPAARPRTSSWCATRIPRTTSPGAPVNQPMAEAHFDGIYAKMLAFWQGHDLYVQDCFAGADPRYQLPIRVVTQFAWHALFARQLFIRPDPMRTDGARPRVHRLLRAAVSGRSRRGRHQLRNLHRHQLHARTSCSSAAPATPAR